MWEAQGDDAKLLPTPTVGDFQKGRLTKGDTQSQNGLTNLIRVQLAGEQ